jgi:hypothetical protein
MKTTPPTPKATAPQQNAGGALPPRKVRAWTHHTLQGERDENYLPVLGQGPISFTLPEFGRPVR